MHDVLVPVPVHCAPTKNAYGPNKKKAHVWPLQKESARTPLCDRDGIRTRARRLVPKTSALDRSATLPYMLTRFKVCS